MFKKYKNLILSQICALVAAAAFVLAFLRYHQVHAVDGMAFGFIAFGVVLFSLEVKLLRDWLRLRRAAIQFLNH